MTHEARQQRLEGRSVTHQKPLSKSRVQVVKVEPSCVIEALSQTPGVEVLPEIMRLV